MSSGSNYRRRGVQVRPQSTSNIRRVAGGFRKFLDIRESNIDMGEFLEVTLHQNGVIFHIDDPSHPFLLPDEDACALPDDRKIILTPRTYDGIYHGDPRARFTLAHEVGHILLHNSEIQGLARGNRLGTSHKVYCDSEWQADTFAAEFLMPADIARGMSEEEIMNTFGVSHSSATIRRKVLCAKR